MCLENPLCSLSVEHLLDITLLQFWQDKKKPSPVLLWNVQVGLQNPVLIPDWFCFQSLTTLQNQAAFPKLLLDSSSDQYQISYFLHHPPYERQLVFIRPFPSKFLFSSICWLDNVGLFLIFVPKIWIYWSKSNMQVFTVNSTLLLILSFKQKQALSWFISECSIPPPQLSFLASKKEHILYAVSPCSCPWLWVYASSSSEFFLSPLLCQMSYICR